MNTHSAPNLSGTQDSLLAGIPNLSLYLVWIDLLVVYWQVWHMFGTDPV